MAKLYLAGIEYKEDKIENNELIELLKERDPSVSTLECVGLKVKDETQYDKEIREFGGEPLWVSVDSYGGLPVLEKKIIVWNERKVISDFEWHLRLQELTMDDLILFMKVYEDDDWEGETYSIEYYYANRYIIVKVECPFYDDGGNVAGYDRYAYLYKIENFDEYKIMDVSIDYDRSRVVICKDNDEKEIYSTRRIVLDIAKKYVRLKEKVDDKVVLDVKVIAKEDLILRGVAWIIKEDDGNLKEAKVVGFIDASLDEKEKEIIRKVVKAEELRKL